MTLGWGRLGRPLALLAIAFSALAVVGGGGTYVAMSITTKPEFCGTCHIMKPYVESWRSSSHNMVPCVDCHYEPGLLETFEGKFKALSQLAKYATGTQGTKPWAEVSDYSCMRSGCHSNRLLEGEIQFGKIRFDHRHHLIDLKRGKKLRCTSCHSQIVQGESHLTVTSSTCILCHFKPGPLANPKMRRCTTCHEAPRQPIDIGGVTFLHKDFVDRGVACLDCHGDVTRGDGAVPRARCGSCHNKREHLERYGDDAFLHQKHVADHSVKCLECHMEIEHTLPTKTVHAKAGQACSDCHTEPHGASSGLYQGKGGVGVADEPSVMFEARVTCNGCHRPPFAGAPDPAPGTTWKADPLACIDCHGPGFEGMAGRWQAEIRATSEAVKKRLEALGKRIDEGGADPKALREHHEAAAQNLALVLLDGSEGVHNLPYARSLLGRAAEDVRAGERLLAGGKEPPSLRVGPRVTTKAGCTLLCHAGIETVKVDRFGPYGFEHAPHFLTAGLDCSDCHSTGTPGAGSHGKTIVKPASCVECHHEDADEEAQCVRCHVDVKAIRTAKGLEAPMTDLDCLACHEKVGEKLDVAAIQAACDDCHEDDGERFAAGHYDAWKDAALAPLRVVRERLVSAPPRLQASIRREIEALEHAGPWHNAAYAKAAATRWTKEIDEAAEGK